MATIFDITDVEVVDLATSHTVALDEITTQLIAEPQLDAIEVATEPAFDVIEVVTAGPQGPAGVENVVVSATQPPAPTDPQPGVTYIWLEPI